MSKRDPKLLVGNILDRAQKILLNEVSIDTALNAISSLKRKHIPIELADLFIPVMAMAN